jgi:uncharacterized membrane protein YkvA (DUF1232 family)
MVARFRLAKRLFYELPGQLRLAYCLLRDPRVPTYTKAALGGGLVVLLGPRKRVSNKIPFVGELDAVAISLVALRLFIAACPDEVVIEQEQLIIEQRSIFDDDMRRGERAILALVRRFRGEPDNDIVGTAQRQVETYAPVNAADPGRSE